MTGSRHRASWTGLLLALSATSLLVGQEECIPEQTRDVFPPGQVGVNYDCVLIDLIDLDEPELDGFLDDQVWGLAPFHPHNFQWSGGREGGQLNDPDNICPSWAAVATETHLYIAWMVLDDIRQDQETLGCGSFNDDAQQIYIDFGNERTDNAYDENDVQLVFGANQTVTEKQEFLEVGWVSRGGCIFEGVETDIETGEPIIEGKIEDLLDAKGEKIVGWQGEISIALQAMPQNGKIWNVKAKEGTEIGIDLHVTDDDLGGGQGGGDDSSYIWAESGASSTAWANPAVFGKLTFREIDPIDGGKGPLFVRGDANSDGSVNLTDGVKILNFLFLGEAPPECLDAADFDDTGRNELTITDAIGVFNWLFLGSDDPPFPAPSVAQNYPEEDCGLDPTDDDGLDCAVPASCSP